jgi:DNA-binding XRE family transcriptional regulator
MNETPADTERPVRKGGRRRSPIIQNGDAIRSLREKDGSTQGEFAKAVGISQAALSNIENEKKAAGRITLNLIARALCVPTRAVMANPSLREAEPAGAEDAHGVAA